MKGVLWHFVSVHLKHLSPVSINRMSTAVIRAFFHVLWCTHFMIKHVYMGVCVCTHIYTYTYVFVYFPPGEWMLENPQITPITHPGSWGRDPCCSMWVPGLRLIRTCELTCEQNRASLSLPVTLWGIQEAGLRQGHKVETKFLLPSNKPLVGDKPYVWGKGDIWQNQL